MDASSYITRNSSRTEFLKRGSPKLCQGFRDRKTRNGGTLSLAVQICTYELKCVRRHSTPVVPSLTAPNQPLLHFRRSLILQSSQSAKLTIDRVGVSGETIRLQISLRLKVRVKVRQPHYRPGQALRFPELQENWHMKVVGLSALRTGRLYPPGNIPGTHFC